jgi:hypothetical protein
LRACDLTHLEKNCLALSTSMALVGMQGWNGGGIKERNPPVTFTENLFCRDLLRRSVSHLMAATTQALNHATQTIVHIPLLDGRDRRRPASINGPPTPCGPSGLFEGHPLLSRKEQRAGLNASRPGDHFRAVGRPGASAEHRSSRTKKPRALLSRGEALANRFEKTPGRTAPPVHL